jgi:hypothetical protein
VPAPSLCEVHVGLAATVAKAVQELYAAKAEIKRARILKLEPTNRLVQVALAKATEQKAIAAFEKHREEHGC